MAYTLNRYDGSVFAVLEDGGLNYQSCLGLVGRNSIGFGEIHNENFLFLLENFARSTAPSPAVTGQTWYNTTTNILSVYNGTKFNPVGSAVVSSDEPVDPYEGQFWFNSVTKQLNVYHNLAWTMTGPESVAGFGVTRSVSISVKDLSGSTHPIILLVVNDKVMAISSRTAFTIDQTSVPSSYVLSEFNTGLVAGITLASSATLSGEITGNAASASRLKDEIQINGVGFTGDSSITIKASTTNKLKIGSYLTGSDYDGSTVVQLAVDATSSATAGKVVARDANGNISANIVTATKFAGYVEAGSTTTSTFGTISAKVITADTLTISGNEFNGTAKYATELKTARTINGVAFNGASDITVTASAVTLTGDTLKSSIVNSSLTSVGQLGSLAVANLGIKIGTSPELDLYINSNNIPVISATAGTLKIDLGIGGATCNFINSDRAAELSWEQFPAIYTTNPTNLGADSTRFNTIYATTFNGTSTQARYADLAENYVADSDYEPGTVVEFGGEFEVTIGTNRSPRVAGIVSTNPAYLMNAGQEGQYVVPVALQGKVPCKVAGTVRKGDMMISGGHGYAIASENPLIGSVIGKALQDFDGEYGTIDVVTGRI